MGRKKKQVEEITGEPSTQEQIKVETKNPLPLSYDGQVKVSFAVGKKIISSKVYHNNGSNRLFQFLTKCLAGKFVEASYSLPLKIKFYKVKTAITTGESAESGYVSPETVRLLFANSEFPEDLLEASSFIFMSQETDVEDTPSAKAILHFTVPRYLITTNEYHAIALFPKSNAADNQWLAYFLFTKQVTKQGITSEEWDAVDLTDANQDLIIIVEWTMAIDNLPATPTTSAAT